MAPSLPILSLTNRGQTTTVQEGALLLMFHQEETMVEVALAQPTEAEMETIREETRETAAVAVAMVA